MSGFIRVIKERGVTVGGGGGGNGSTFVFVLPVMVGGGGAVDPIFAFVQGMVVDDDWDSFLIGRRVVDGCCGVVASKGSFLIG